MAEVCSSFSVVQLAKLSLAIKLDGDNHADTIRGRRSQSFNPPHRRDFINELATQPVIRSNAEIGLRMLADR